MTGEFVLVATRLDDLAKLVYPQIRGFEAFATALIGHEDSGLPYLVAGALGSFLETLETRRVAGSASPEDLLGLADAYGVLEGLAAVDDQPLRRCLVEGLFERLPDQGPVHDSIWSHLDDRSQDLFRQSQE